VEVLGDADRLLAGGGVADEEDFIRLDGIAEADEFLDEGLVDLLASGGVEDEEVEFFLIGPGGGGLSDAEDVGLSRVGAKNGDVGLPGENGELFDGGGADQVAGNEANAAALFEEVAGEFAGAGGFAGAVEPDHEDASALVVEAEFFGISSEQGDEFVVEYFDDLLARSDAPEDFLTESFVFD
jgi:hypothetical protein